MTQQHLSLSLINLSCPAANKLPEKLRPIPGSVRGQVRRGLEEADLVDGVPDRGGGWNKMNLKKTLPTQIIPLINTGST